MFPINDRVAGLLFAILIGIGLCFLNAFLGFAFFFGLFFLAAVTL